MEHVVFENEWLVRFGLKKGAWKKAVRQHIDDLPFGDESGVELVNFLFGELPDLLKKKPDAETALLARAYGWVCFAFWQCGSAFPVFPENYATFLKKQILKSTAKRDPSARLLANMFLPQSAAPGDEVVCGFNRLQVADADLIRKSEELIHQGGYEFYLKAKEKYEEYEFYLKSSEEFRADWNRINIVFPNQIPKDEIIHRTLLHERNWERGAGPQFEDVAGRFQAVFDFFCWKYYLWGMRGDQPFLLKTSVVFTPYGTQLFIPGYLSFDPKRDLDFSKVMRLHRARGISRQGPNFSIGRREHAERRRKAKAADREARRKGLKGDARYDYICKQVGIKDSGDYRSLRKLLK